MKCQEKDKSCCLQILCFSSGRRQHNRETLLTKDSFTYFSSWFLPKYREKLQFAGTAFISPPKMLVKGLKYIPRLFGETCLSKVLKSHHVWGNTEFKAVRSSSKSWYINRVLTVRAGKGFQMIPALCPRASPTSLFHREVNNCGQKISKKWKTLPACQNSDLDRELVVFFF